jgi:hypothetical protein
MLALQTPQGAYCRYRIDDQSTALHVWMAPAWQEKM